MNLEAITKLFECKKAAFTVKAEISLRINDEMFRPGTVRVHLPAPINASWLKEGQLLSTSPEFRMVSTEDYPQRSIYYNEILKENTVFSASYAFESVHSYLKPDLELCDQTEQKGWSPAQSAAFSGTHHCECESYTALKPDMIRPGDICEEEGIRFLQTYKDFLKDYGIDPDSEELHKLSMTERGTLARKIYDLITEKYIPAKDETLNIVFVSMCRMCGIPARWQGGWHTKDIIENTSSQPIQASGHDWALIHIMPYGFIFADCENAKKAGNMKIPGSDESLKEYFFGNIDPCMVPTASAPSRDLYPAKDYERADKIFNTFGEVELIPGKMSSEGHFEGYGLKIGEFGSNITIQVYSSSSAI